MSARVGSVADNRAGGWYSYRASKAAVNSLTKSFDHQLRARCGDKALAVAYHPGTVRTDLSRDYWAGVPEGKLFEPDDAAAKMARVLLETVGPAHRGRCWDWKGEEVYEVEDAETEAEVTVTATSSDGDGNDSKEKAKGKGKGRGSSFGAVRNFHAYVDQGPEHAHADHWDANWPAMNPADPSSFDRLWGARAAQEAGARLLDFWHAETAWEDGVADWLRDEVFLLSPDATPSDNTV